MKFSELLRQPVAEDFEVQDVLDDSRHVKAGDVFVFDRRIHADVKKFAAEAQQKGARAIITNEENVGTFMAHPGDVLARWATHKWPKQPEKTVGVTGTNGKTSVAWFYHQLAAGCGHKAATLGTMGNFINGEKIGESGYTSPTALKLHQTLQQLVQDKVTHACLEVSSHGLDLHRCEGVHFTAAAFTNLSPDHRDYHGSMEAYAAAKQRLFSELLPQDGCAVLNVQRPECWPLASVCKQRELNIITYGTANAELIVRPVSLQPGKMDVEIRFKEYHETKQLPLIGVFQAENVAAAVGLALASGLSWQKIIKALDNLHSVPGRMEVMNEGAADQPVVVVDYAHTPDALKNALQGIRPQVKGKLWVIFGCGGDRDRAKRPQMGKIAMELADEVIVSDDNPRSEEAAEIRREILSACPDATEIGDRAQAIGHAITQAGPEDTVLLAGKGHERGQIVQGEIIPFSDREEALKVLGLKGAA